MKLIGRLVLIILISYLGQCCVSGNLNVKKMLTQISKGDLSKEEVIKFYNKDYDPLLEHHKIFTPCLNHLIDQEMKTESFLTRIFESVRELFTSSYEEYSIPELGLKVKCETYINNLISPEYIEKKKKDTNELKKFIIGKTQTEPNKKKLRTQEENEKPIKTTANKLKKNKIRKEEEKAIAPPLFFNKDTKKEELIEYQVRPDKLLDNGCGQQLENLKKINEILTKEKESIQKLLSNKSLEFTKVNDESCKCREEKNKLEGELNNCRKDKAETEIAKNQESANKALVAISDSKADEKLKDEIKKKIEENTKCKEELTKLKSDAESLVKEVEKVKKEKSDEKSTSDKLLKQKTEQCEKDTKDLTQKFNNCKTEKEKENKECINSQDELKTCMEKNKLLEERLKKLDLKTGDEIGKNQPNARLIGKNDSNNNNNLNKSDSNETKDLSNKLKMCEIKNEEKEKLLTDLKTETDKKQSKIDALEREIDSNRKITVEKQKEIDKCKSDVNEKNELYSKAQKSVESVTKLIETQKNGYLSQINDLNAQLLKCKSAPAPTPEADHSLCKEKENELNETIKKITKQNENCIKNLKEAEDKSQSKIVELNKQIGNLEQKFDQNSQLLSQEQDRNRKCTELNQNMLKEYKEKKKTKLKKIHESYSSKITTLNQDIENLKNNFKIEKDDLNKQLTNLEKACTKEKQDLNMRLTETKKDLETCKTNLEKEQISTKNDYLPKKICEESINRCEENLKTKQNELTQCKSNKCPECPPCREVAFSKEIVKLTKDTIDFEKQIKELTEKEKKCQIDLKNKETKLAEETKKCNEDIKKLEIQNAAQKKEIKENCDKMIDNLKNEKNKLIQMNKEADKKQEECEKIKQTNDENKIHLADLERCKNNVLSLEKQLHEKDGKLKDSEGNLMKKENELKICMEKSKEEIDSTDKLKKTIKEKDQKIQELNKAQTLKESECANVYFEFKNRLISESGDFEVLKTDIDSKTTLIGTMIKRLQNDIEIDQKNLQNSVKINDVKIKEVREINDSIKKQKVIDKDLEKKKESLLMELNDSKNAGNPDAIKKIALEFQKIEMLFKKSQLLLKQYYQSNDKLDDSIAKVNVDIAIVENQIKDKNNDKIKLEKIYDEMKQNYNKFEKITNDRGSLIKDYSVKIENIVKANIKSKTLSANLEKNLIEYKNLYIKLEQNSALIKKTFEQKSFKDSEEFNKEKNRLNDEINRMKISTNEKCFDELKSILNSISKSNSASGVSSGNSDLITGGSTGVPIGMRTGSLNGAVTIDMCVKILDNKENTENKCKLLEPLRLKYNDNCHENPLAPPNKEILTFATNSLRNSNNDLLRRLNDKKKLF